MNRNDPQNFQLLVARNNEIALCASRKDLDKAMEIFEEMVNDKWANSHSYSAAINANIRCGNLNGAISVYGRLKETGHKPDVILCTTLMKGFCSEGKMDKALLLLEEMKRRPASMPNIRTINTYLRGCVMTGTIDKAEQLLSTMMLEYKVSPDISTWEYVVTLLCQGLNLDKASPIVGRISTSDVAMAGGVGAMQISIARAAALMSEWKVCKKSLKLAVDALQIDENYDGGVSGGGDEGGTSAAADAEVSNKCKAAVGGKRSWKADHSENISAAAQAGEESRGQSLALFREHRRAELRQEITIITDFMTSRQQATPPISLPASEDKSGSLAVNKLSNLMSFYTRVLSFADQAGSGDDDDVGATGESTASQLATSVLHKYGLLNCLQRIHTAAAVTPATPDVTTRPSDKCAKKTKNKKVVKEKNEQGVMSFPSDGLAGRCLAQYQTYLRQIITPEGHIDFQKMFAASSKSALLCPSSSSQPLASSSSQAPLVINLEVCSGAGEWAVAQAVSDSRPKWVTLELRHDRAYQTFCRSVFANVDNVGVIAGDAMQVLPQKMFQASVDNVFVNHPEPPQQTGSHVSHLSQGKHLLTPSFFAAVARVLKDKGKFTIVTDNQWYGQFLLKQCAQQIQNHPWLGLSSVQLTRAPVKNIKSNGKTNDKLNKNYNGKKKHNSKPEEVVVEAGSGKFRLLDSDGSVQLYEGCPGLACGHLVEASSYFDRLWSRGKLVERYFLVFVKSASHYDEGKLQQSMATAAAAAEAATAVAASNMLAVKSAAPAAVVGVSGPLSLRLAVPVKQRTSITTPHFLVTTVESQSKRIKFDVDE